MRDFEAILQAELDVLASADRLRVCFPLTGSSRTTPQAASGPLLSFASNDYLGLASHPALIAAATEAARSDGFGAGAARLVTGDLAAHRALEEALAGFLGRPATLLFPSGYQANIGVVTALAGPDDLIASDAANHASLIDGCRLSRATLAVYAHGDVDAARNALARPGRFRRRLLLTESLFSMDGDAAPLTALAALASAHDAILVVDEAHAFGALGPGGRGLCAGQGVAPEVIIGTLGKAFGAAGGFVAGSTALRATLVNRARTFVYTTAPPPPVAGAALAALRLIRGPEGDQRRADLAANLEHLAQGLPVDHPRPPGPIVPLVFGSDARALHAAAHLRSRGLFVPAIRPPTVPEGTARLRLTVSSAHTAAQLGELLTALREVWP